MRARRFRPSIDSLDLRIAPSDTNPIAPGCIFPPPQGEQVPYLGQSTDPESDNITGSVCTGVPFTVDGMPNDLSSPDGTSGSFYQ